MKVRLDEITLDKDIYPRINPSSKVIEAYLESLKAGEKFPPILLQRLKYENEGVKTVLIDGFHRVEAYKLFNDWLKSEKKQKRLVENEELKEPLGLFPIEEVECEYWRTEVLEKEKWLTQLQLESARRNARHGLQLTYEDKKTQARKICEANPDIRSEEIAYALGVSPRTVREWVKDIRLRQKAEREAVVYRLNLLGWTQEEMAEAIGKAQSRVSEILSEMADLPKLIKSFLARGERVEAIAEKLNIDVQLAWAIALEGLNDFERLGKLDSEVKGLNCKPRPYDVWRFEEPHELFGYRYEGQIPGQLILQLLYFYTEQGDLVVDPMAGSGTVVDACLLMNRRCLAFDINPECAKRRLDIRVVDAIEAIRNLKERAKLIFIDPPYFKKKEREYGKLSISSLPREEYLEYFSRLARECTKKITPDGRVALLMSDYTEEDPSESIFIHHYINRFEKEGFIVERIIQCPLSTQQIHPDFILKFTGSRKLARLSRNLVIFRASRPQ